MPAIGWQWMLRNGLYVILICFSNEWNYLQWLSLYLVVSWNHISCSCQKRLRAQVEHTHLPCEASDMPLSDVTTPYGLKVCSKSFLFCYKFRCISATFINFWLSFPEALPWGRGASRPPSTSCSCSTSSFLWVCTHIFTHLHTSLLHWSYMTPHQFSSSVSSVKTACCALVQCPSPWFYQFHLWASFFLVKWVWRSLTIRSSRQQVFAYHCFSAYAPSTLFFHGHILPLGHAWPHSSCLHWPEYFRNTLHTS